MQVMRFWQDNQITRARQPKRSMIKDTRNKAVLCISVLVVSLFSALVLMEIAVRIFLPQRLDTPINFYCPDQLLGWRLKPNLHASFQNTDFVSRIDSNEAGFRDAPHRYAKGPKKRILGIGDSILFGYGVDYDKNALTLLQKGLDVETINLGMTGYNINQYYKTLVYEGSRYRPDLVVLFFFVNDWAKDEKYDFNGVTRDGYLGSDRFSLNSVECLLFPARDFLRRHSHLYILIRERIRNLLARLRMIHVQSISPVFDKGGFNADEYARTLDLIGRMSEFCANELSCPFILCMIPDRIQVVKRHRDFIMGYYGLNPDDYDFARPHALLADFCSREKITYLDMMPVFLNNREADTLYLKRDPHWSARGHSLAAETVSAFISENKLL